MPKKADARLAEYEDMLRGCEVGEEYDLALKSKEEEDDVRSVVNLAARNVLNKRVRITSRDENGKRILRVLVTSVPAVQRTLNPTEINSTFHMQDYYDDLVRNAKPGKGYEVIVERPTYPSDMRRLQTAGRNVLQRRLDIRLRHEGDKTILRYEVTDNPSMPIGQYRMGMGRRHDREQPMRTARPTA